MAQKVSNPHIDLSKKEHEKEWKWTLVTSGALQYIMLYFA